MDLTALRNQLVSEKNRLLSTRLVLEDEQGTKVAGQRVVDVTEASPQDPAEVGEQATGRSAVLSELHLLDAELVEVDAALARIDTGTYGHCEDCGEPIDPERLATLPAARRCAVDQRAYEMPSGGLWS